MNPGRNDPCPCGSGRKYKHCCGSLSAAATTETPERLVDAADAARARGQPGESVPLYRRALAIDPQLTQAHNNLGNAFLELAQPAQAAVCYRKAHELLPGNAHILCNLGNTLRQLGQLQEAIVCAERAIALEPGLSMAHNILGLSLTGIGQRERAVAAFQRALQLQPRYVEALTNLADVMRDMGQTRAALPLYRQAIDLDPQRADCHCNLGKRLLELRRVEEAVRSLRRALALQPEHFTAHLNLAAALRQQGLASEAEKSAQAALAIDPNRAEALVLLGELRGDQGDRVQAQELFGRALAADPSFPSVYWSIAAHRRMSLEDSAWLQAVQGLLRTPLPLAEEISLRFALGKYFDDTGQYDSAFAGYRQAHELRKRSAAAYDKTKLTARVERMIAGVDAAFLRASHACASASELPVFIIGMPRSGTSLTEQILASHAAVYGAGEVRFWDGAFTTLESAGLGSASAAQLIPDLARSYLERVSAGAGGSWRIVDKMPANFLHAGVIHAVFPRARIIHMRRHPLDTCLSIYFQNFFHAFPYADDLETLAHYYGQYLRITDHWRGVLPAEALLEVPYEGLVQDQEGWTRRMLEFIGLPWDPQCLDFQQTERVVITASRWQVRQRINAASVGRWRHYAKHLGPLQHLAPDESVR
jgi:tetratricopeptide (TPR) repeat protein